jgi:ketosteroid isomerase-like protein
MERSDEIRELIQSYYRAAQAGYGDDASALVSKQDGVIVIGSDPDEWWDGEGYNRAMRAQAEAMGGAIPIQHGDIQAYREGSVAWVVDRPTFRFDDGTEVPARASIILHQEHGGWKIVHLHLSMGIPNEEALGEELPI